MPEAESTLSGRLEGAKPAAVRRRLHGWGGGGGAPATVLSARDVAQVEAAIAQARASQRKGRARPTAIPRGMGRSYGDAAQLRDGFVIDTTALKGMVLDTERGIVEAGAGATIGDLLARCVPAGWMVPVAPGTQHVSVGGAIASDIHGKNHGTASTFGRHVSRLSLLLASGEQKELTPGDPLFEATLGGMGLTGVVVSAQIALQPVRSPFVSVDTDRVSSLDDALAALRAPGGPLRVAWLDLLGREPARGVVTRADYLPTPPPGRAGSATVPSRLTVPAWFPRGLLRPETIRAFNELRFRRSPRRQRGHAESIGHHLFPLDALDAWPRLYGPSGFLQYQLVVPLGQEPAMEGAIMALRRTGVPCYLAVLKDFGPANGAPLSFPIQGWTLTLDVPRAAPRLDEALDACDELVAAAGGRVYLAKDARLRPEVMRAMYPRLREWQEVRDSADPEGLWASDLALRAGLVDV